MNIINLKSWKSLSVMTVAALLFTVGVGEIARAAHPAGLHMETAATGAAVLNGNGGPTLTTFSPAISPGGNLQSSATSSASAYYGVHITSSTTTGDVYWQITVSHATTALTPGMVTLTEKGYFDATGGTVADSGYGATAVSGDLVFIGNAGWEVFAGDDFTNVDQIVFDDSAPIGAYTITRELIENATDTEVDATSSYVFTLNLTAPADITAPNAPSVTVFPQCSTSSPVTISGTAEANADIMIHQTASGTTTSTSTSASANGSGAWSAMINLFANRLNTLHITATDAGDNTSATTTIQLTHDTTAPTISLKGQETIVTFNRNPFVDPGVTLSDNLDTSLTATTTGQFDHTVPGTYTLTYTVEDCAGNTATTTRTVIIQAASSGSNGGGGGGGNSNNNPNPPGIAVAASVTPTASLIPGQAIGLTALQLGLQPPGQVLGATTVKVMFTQNMRVGSRGPAVTALQTKLTELGFYNGPITGYFGGLTRAAVVAYQRANGLPQGGQVGPLTRGLLNR